LDTRSQGWFHPWVLDRLQNWKLPPRALLNVLGAGAVLRVIDLGTHSLWLDEGATWSWATRPTWGGTILAEANHPPAWWIVTRLWTGWFGESEWTLRAPAAILGIVTMWLAYQLGLRLLDPTRQPRRGGFTRDGDVGQGRRLAIWFTGFVAASTYMIEYSQDARMYSALLAEALGLSLLYLRWLDRGGRGSLIGYALLAALALYTQYFAIWIIAGHGAHALWLWWSARKTDQPFDPRPFVASTIVAGLLFVPWLVYMLRNYEGISTGDPFNPFSRLGYILWRIGAGPGLVVVDRARLDDGVGAVVSEESTIAIVTSLLWFTPLVFGAWRLRRLPGVASFVAANVLVPIALVLLVFVKFPLMHERYMLFLAPWLVLTATIGALRAPGALKVVLTAGLIVLSVTGLVAFFGAPAYFQGFGKGATIGDESLPQSYGTDPDHRLHFLHHGHPYGKEPWRQARQFILERSKTDEEAEQGRGDLVLLHPEYLHLVWDFYDRRRLERVLLPRETISAEEIRKRYGERLAGRDRIFLILAHEETEDPDYYYDAVGKAVRRIWVEEGMGGIEQSPPILFDRSWGVRVAIFNRK